MNTLPILDIALGVLSALIVSALLTGIVRKLAQTYGVIDMPGPRHSHSTPTPRGGGVAVVITLMAGMAIMALVGALPLRLTTALMMGGGAVATVGFIDDIWQVAPLIRLMVHFAAISFFACSIGQLPPIYVGSAIWDLGVLGMVFGILVLVWFLNLYNFMDGIDGIAGVEAMSTAAAAAVLLLLIGVESPALLLLPLIVAAVGGFLIWNWSPARIFMGDAGSGFLGFILGAVAWMTAATGQLSIWVWFILFGVFFVDATVTLIRRWSIGASLANPHRSHAYQHLSRRLGSHKKVAVGCLLINIFWLDPLAWFAAIHPSLGALLFIVAWVPLVIYAWRCGAGMPEN